MSGAASRQARRDRGGRGVSHNDVMPREFVGRVCPRSVPAELGHDGVRAGKRAVRLGFPGKCQLRHTQREPHRAGSIVQLFRLLPRGEASS